LQEYDISQGSVFIVNNLPYIAVLEYGGYPNPPSDPVHGKTIGGYSKQAPQGMVRVTAVELKPLVAVVMAKMKVIGQAIASIGAGI
jgi:hypothetical protein